MNGSSMPPAVTGKRKRDAHDPSSPRQHKCTVIQIVTGSYERVLHGFTAVLTQDGEQSPLEPTQDATFTQTFLFNAHGSSIRCLAISPSSSSTYQNPSKRILASGGTDERINLYQLAASSSPDTHSAKPLLPATSSRNHELGSLLHHTSTVSTLIFPSRGKLLSASIDNSIAITRVRDWAVLSTIKAPIPKPAGRPSGDTAAAGEVPAGVNDVAVHPSAKLMLSVGQGERCMRLWNLVTGKKAGVLTFSREALAAVSEGRWRGGEGRSVVWDEAGEEFAVAFDKGVVVYGLDCEARTVVIPVPATKVQRVRYLPALGTTGNESGQKSEGKRSSNILAMSTEDGRILFYDTYSIATAAISMSNDGPPPLIPKKTNTLLPKCTLLAQLGGRNHGIINRIKDFEILKQHPLHPKNTTDVKSVEHHNQALTSSNPSTDSPTILIISASSDGAVRLWNLDPNDLNPSMIRPTNTKQTAAAPPEAAPLQPAQPVSTPETDHATTNGSAAHATPALNGQAPVRQVGTLLGTHETGARITCLAAFVMDEPARASTSPGDNEGAEGAESVEGDHDNAAGKPVEDDDSGEETVGGAVANGGGGGDGGCGGTEEGEWGGLDDE